MANEHGGRRGIDQMKKESDGRTEEDGTRRGQVLLATFISSIPAVFLLDPVLHDPNYIVSSGADTRVP